MIEDMEDYDENMRPVGHPLREAVFKELGEAIAEHGVVEGPKIVYAKYVSSGKINRVTWKRWREKYGLPGKVERAKIAAQQAMEKIGDSLPATPSPAYIARRPAEATKNLDFFGKLMAIDHDIAMIREYSIRRERLADGKEVEKITNPVFFTQQVKLNIDTFQQQLATLQQMYDLNMMAQFYDAIIDEVGKEAPACAKRIMERLVRLNQERGFVLNR